MENISDYQVKSHKKTLRYLKKITIEKCLIAANCGDNPVFLTEILDIDEQQNTLTLSCSPSDYLNENLFNSNTVNFITEHDGIEVRFESQCLKKQGDALQPLLTMPIPEHLYWIQRRSHSRIRSPFSKNSFCSVKMKSINTETEHETYNFKLYDLSLTGFSIISKSLETAQTLTVNDQYNNCELVLDGQEALTISLIVRNSFTLNPNELNKDQRIGCELVNIEAHQKSILMKYIQHIKDELYAY